MTVFTEIPLFHVLNAKITFGNIFATEAAAPGVVAGPTGEQMQCTIDESVFLSPTTYSVIGKLFVVLFNLASYCEILKMIRYLYLRSNAVCILPLSTGKFFSMWLVSADSQYRLTRCMYHNC